jgi:ferredoxin-NADP reductase/predicted pyridoxine 5'-phosphate oxidase superfamily flavin-nucleotide-binding protein
MSLFVGFLPPFKYTVIQGYIMAHQYAKIAFTDTVRQVQSEQNSRNGYASMDQGEDYNYLLSQNEADFIHARDSFYVASVSETDWPYLQHRGGPKGFMQVIDESTLGFADFSGNRQYVSTGNFRSNDRVALFFMDYPNRRRLKMLGRIELVENTDWDLMAKLEEASSGKKGRYRASVERGFLIHIEAFDWNCPQHITPRFSEDEIEKAIEPLLEENKALKDQLATPLENSLKIDSVDDLNNVSHLVWGEGELPLVVSGIRQLTPRIRAYEFRHRDGLELPEFKAGAHLKIPLPPLAKGGQGNDKAGKRERHYSICSNPKRRDIYEISILKEEQGLGGSLAIHQQLQLGQEVHCALPENHFTLHDDDRPAVLFAGGIGITPIKAMAQSLQCRGNTLSIHYAGRSYAEMAFQDRLQHAFNQNIQFYSAALKQRLDIKNVMIKADEDAVFYVCGPSSLIDTVIAAGVELNIQQGRIRFERFSHSISSASKPIRVEFSKSNQVIQVERDQTILDAALAAGIEIPFSCKNGDCKTCAVEVLEGQALHLDNSLSEHERLDKKLMCPCVSRAIDDSIVLDI